MQRNFFLIAALFVFVFMAFSQSVPAKTAKEKPKIITKAESDKREVKKFAASFINTLDETKDLNEVSSDFFVKDFKTHQIQSTSDFDNYEDQLKQLSIDDQFKHQIAYYNLNYLGIMWNGGSQHFFIEKMKTKKKRMKTKKLWLTYFRLKL